MNSRDRDIADRLLRIAADAGSAQTREERDFSSLLHATRRNFRRGEESAVGRKKKDSFKRKVILLKLAHADFFPPMGSCVF